MSKQITQLRLFVASPDEVKGERETITKVVNELNNSFERDAIQLKVVKWETDAAPGVADYSQQVINNDIGDDFDIFVGIMWTRFGSSTPHASSGTEEEFNNAYKRYQQNPDNLQIMFYFNQAPKNPNDIDPEQLKLINEFKSKLGDQGVLYWTYDGIDSFEPLFRTHLTKKVQNWGKTWGTDTGKTIDATEEIDETQEINDFDDDDDYGFIELIEIGNDSLEISNNAIMMITSATETVGQEMGKRAKEFEQSQVPTPNMKQGKMVLRRTADNMEQFVKRVEPEIPIFSDNFSKGINYYTRATTLINDFQGENEEQIEDALNNIREMRNSIIQALGGTQSLRDATYKLPRISRDITIAKKHMGKTLDNLIYEIDSAKDLTAEAENSLEQTLIENRTQSQRNPQIPPKQIE